MRQPHALGLRLVRDAGGQWQVLGGAALPCPAEIEIGGVHGPNSVQWRPRQRALAPVHGAASTTSVCGPPVHCYVILYYIQEA